MGVDFSMRCCAPVSDKECELVVSSFSERKSTVLYALLGHDGLRYGLRPLGEPCPWASLRQLIDKQVSFEFYDKMSGFAYECPEIVPCECCFAPKAVLETLEALQEAIEKYDPQLPIHFYWIVHQPDGTSMEMGYEGQHLSVLWKGEPYRLNVGWSKCYLEAPDGKRIDLRGRELESLEMQEVCRTALRYGWLIFTHIW